METLLFHISIGIGEVNKGGISRSKHIGYLGCKFKLNDIFSELVMIDLVNSRN